MDDRMRVSDADREALTTRLRDHYAEGRLTQDELDERVSAALGAKTFGELRTLTTDLPGPVPVPPRTVARPTWDGPPPWRRHHRPPVGLFLLIALLLVLSSGGGWAVFGFFRLLLVFWLAMMVTRIVIGLVYRRRHR